MARKIRVDPSTFIDKEQEAYIRKLYENMEEVVQRMTYINKYVDKLAGTMTRQHPLISTVEDLMDSMDDIYSDMLTGDWADVMDNFYDLLNTK